MTAKKWSVPARNRSHRTDNLPSSSEKAACPDCGVEYSLRGMSGHRKGLRCKVDTVVRAYREKGKEPLGSDKDGDTSEWRSMLIAAKVPFEEDRAFYVAGDQTRDSLAKTGLYVNSELAQAARLLTRFPIYSMPWVEKVQLLSRCKEIEFRRAFLSLHALSAGRLRDESALRPEWNDEVDKELEFHQTVRDLMKRWEGA